MSGPPKAGVDGNWQCEQCGNINYAVRTVCNRCREPKPASRDEPWDSKRAPYGYGGPPPAQRPPARDPYDPYGFQPPAGPPRDPYTQFDPQGFQPQFQPPPNAYPMPFPGGAAGPPPGFSAPPTDLRSRLNAPDNWDCIKCTNINFPARTECNRCRAPRPAPEEENKLMTAGTLIKSCGGTVQSAIAFLESLQLDEAGLANLLTCAKRKGGGNAGGGGGGFDRRKRRRGAPEAGVDGNWQCPVPSCGNINFPKREVCNRCSARRP